MQIPKSLKELAQQIRTACFGETKLDIRLGVILTLVLYFGTILIGNLTSYNLFWYTLGVPILGHLFADLQDVLVGLACTRQGFDVLAVDPCMPGAMMRPNYPRLWMWLAPTGLTPNDTLWLGMLIATVFFLCALWLAGKLNFSEAAVYSFVLASPSVMLGVERGNIDLVLFSLLTLALIALNQKPLWRALGYSLIFLTGALKLFPIFAALSILKEKSRAAIGGITVMVAAFAAYAALTFTDLQRINAQVPRTTGLGYGRTVLTDVLQNSALFESVFKFRLQEPFALWLSVILMGFCVGAAYVWAQREKTEEPAPTLALDAFRMGAGIFIGTFAIGGVADYHFIFLIFTLPQLLVWAKTDPTRRVWAGLTLVSLIFTLYLSRWSLTADTAFGIPSKYYLPDEIFNWGLLTLYSYFVLSTLPAWVKQIIFFMPTPKK